MKGLLRGGNACRRMATEVALLTFRQHVHATIEHRIVYLLYMEDMSTEHFTRPAAARPMDIALLTGAMKLGGWLNFFHGTLNIAFYVILATAPFSLLLTGLLSVATWLLVYAKIHFMLHTRNWMDVCLTALCGLYVPLIVLVLTYSQLLDAL